MGQNPNKIAEVYDTVAMEYAEKFCGEHEKKPQDREILYRFSQKVAGKKPIWDFGCGPGQTTQYLKDSFIGLHKPLRQDFNNGKWNDTTYQSQERRRRLQGPYDASKRT